MLEMKEILDKPEPFMSLVTDALLLLKLAETEAVFDPTWQDVFNKHGKEKEWSTKYITSGEMLTIKMYFNDVSNILLTTSQNPIQNDPLSTQSIACNQVKSTDPISMSFTVAPRTLTATEHADVSFEDDDPLGLALSSNTMKQQKKDMSLNYCYIYRPEDGLSKKWMLPVNATGHLILRTTMSQLLPSGSTLVLEDVVSPVKPGSTEYNWHTNHRNKVSKIHLMNHKHVVFDCKEQDQKTKEWGNKRQRSS